MTQPCADCGRDNDNGTHWALENTGHLGHGYRAVLPATIDAAHLERMREFSLRTFGPGLRTEGVIDHIAKEFDEIREKPRGIDEWVDVIILGLDGAQRTGVPVQDIIDAIIAKQGVNEKRDWPDWRTAEPGKAIEHNRTVVAMDMNVYPTACIRCGYPMPWHSQKDIADRCNNALTDGSPAT